MSYALIEFRDATLPDRMVVDDLSTPRVRSTLRTVLGGVYDSYGGRKRKPDPQTVTARGMYLGQAERIYDEEGDYLIDEGGDAILGATATQSLQEQIDALRAELGQKGPLWRRRDGDGALHWKYFRLLEVDAEEDERRVANVLEVSCLFEAAMEYWHAATPTVASGTATDGVELRLFVESPSAVTIEDATLSITSLTGTITAVRVTCASLGIEWEWSGSLPINRVLTINPGDLDIPIDAVGAYENFFEDTGHTAESWLAMTQGRHTILITVTGGDALVTHSHYVQVP